MMIASYAALATAGCLWGTSFLLGKIAFRELSVSHMLTYRFVFASIGLLPFVFTRDMRRQRGHDAQLLGQLLLTAVVGVPIQFLVQFGGLARTSASHASLMVGTLPMLLALGAAMFMGERIDRRGWIAVVASTVGVALIVVGRPDGPTRGGPTLAGDLLVLASLFAAVAWILMSKRLMRELSPMLVAIGVTWIGTVLLVLWTITTEGPPPLHLAPKTWLAVIATGVLGTSATAVLWNWGLSHVPASRAGVFVNLEPAVGAILGVTVLGEALGPLAIVGGILIIAAAGMITVQRQPS